MDPAIIVALISLFGIIFKCFYDSYEKKRENKQDILDTNILIIRYLLLDMEDRCSRVGGKSHEQDMLFTALHDQYLLLLKETGGVNGYVDNAADRWVELNYTDVLK